MLETSCMRGTRVYIKTDLRIKQLRSHFSFKKWGPTTSPGNLSLESSMNPELIY